MARSESNAIVGKVTYPDLNLTHYPDRIDSRNQSDGGFNPNMAGYENMVDYNYAEHVNALEDAVMAIERVLGITPYRDKDGINRNTVSNRISILENRDYDPRYGGSGWDPTQTLIGHTHTGRSGHPSQINLESEVQGRLPKQRLNIAPSSSGGLTGADLALANNDTRKIRDVVNDKLSVSQGGTIRKNLEVQGSFISRLFKEWDATNAGQGSLITDYETMINQSRRGSGTGRVQFFNQRVKNLMYGKYVMGVRAKVSSRVSQQVLELRWYNRLNNKWNLNSQLLLKGTDFDSANEYQMFYLTFEHYGEQSNSDGLFHVYKSATSSNVSLYIDNVFIMPTHPAIYDR